MSLEEHTQQRKERLALLRSAKRKREGDVPEDLGPEKDEEISKMQFRNYDPKTKAPKLGFLSSPAGNEEDTAEDRGRAVIASTLESDEAAIKVVDTPLDVTSIQPVKPNADLKRRLSEKLDRVRGKQALVVANLVRQKIMATKAGEKKILSQGHDPA